MDLTTNYLGLSLRSPLVPSASPLSEKIENIRAMEQAGAAAVVFHSLFEEQIEATAPEFRIDPNTYLENITQAKRAVGIPIIGSLNCTTLGGWISYARRITEAGADALELNIYKIPTRTNVSGSTIENIYIDIVRSVRAANDVDVNILNCAAADVGSRGYLVDIQFQRIGTGFGDSPCVTDPAAKRGAIEAGDNWNTDATSGLRDVFKI